MMNERRQGVGGASERVVAAQLWSERVVEGQLWSEKAGGKRSGPIGQGVEVA